MLVEKGQRFVAFFDLLGFSAWLEAEGSLEVFTYVRGFLNLMIRSSLPGSIVNADMSVIVRDESNMGFINFSDSIVFYTKDDSEECLDTMIKVCGEFMNGVITGPSRMIRGAIAHGDFFADPESNAYVGQALVDAYKLEGRQDWLSFSFHDSVVKLKEFRVLAKKYPSFIVPALVPLRGDSDLPFCLNWGDTSQFREMSFNTERSLLDCYNRARRSLKNNPKETEKLERRIRLTRDFILHYNPKQ